MNKENKNLIDKLNKRLIDVTDSIMVKNTCYFLWGEPKVSDKLSEYYKNKSVMKK